MERREFLVNGGMTAMGLALLGGCAPATTTAPMVPPTVPPPPPLAGRSDEALNAIFTRIFEEKMKAQPAFATVLGIDTGANAALRSTFDPKPAPQARAEQLARDKAALAAVKGVDPATLSPAANLNRDIVIYDLETSILPLERFGLDGVQNPYLITQQDGAYFQIPDFLDSSHPIETAADAEAYLSRLAEFPTILDNQTADQRAMAARGFLAPGWSLDLALGQIGKLRNQPAATNGMVRSIAERTAKKGIAGNWAARATRIVEGGVYPALDRQVAAIKALRPTTAPGDGAQRLPNGDAIYAAALAAATTTNMTPDEVHQLGLQQVADISGQLDTLLKQAGYTRGSVGERLAALNASPAQLYPETDAGRAQLIADLNTSYQAMNAKMSRAFATLPTLPLDIRRVPPEIQDGASNGYYNLASLDGSRPAIYFINLKSVRDWPKYSLPSLTYHEGVPGHHLQLSLSQESKDIPMLRKISFYSSYSEGWALYSEALADELGGYDGIERAGYLQSFLFRAARLVVDTGLNSKGWSRERAVDYMTATTGFPRTRVQREVERYCASIGQACSYKVGHIAWERARKRAEAALGPRFDLRQFHEVLKDGSMPLTILDRRIDERIAQAKVAG